MYLKLKKVKKFTEKDEIDNIIGKPIFQIGSRLVYYYGNGTIIAYSSKRFKVEENKRIEYGEKGIYAISMYHFIDIQMMQEYFKGHFFEASDEINYEDGIIDGDVAYNKTFIDIQNLGLDKKYAGSYKEGETQVLVNGKMEVRNLFIMYGTYILFFRGKSKENKISGFQYTLCE